MRVFRIVKAKHAAGCLSGQGARESGGRWNSPGRAAVYTGESIALCTLEMLAHINDVGLLRLAFVVVELDVPDAVIESLPPDVLPADWAAPEHPECKRIGDEWLASGRSAALLVPSAVVPLERVVLLNPEHPDFGQIEKYPAKPVSFDPRLAIPSE